MTYNWQKYVERNIGLATTKMYLSSYLTNSAVVDLIDFKIFS